MFRLTFLTLKRIELFCLSSLITCAVLSVIFGLYCQIGGHNFTEAIYAWAYIHIFSIGAGFVFAWLNVD